jgi:hypothetical protein
VWQGWVRHALLLHLGQETLLRAQVVDCNFVGHMAVACEALEVLLNLRPGPLKWSGHRSLSQSHQCWLQ